MSLGPRSAPAENPGCCPVCGKRWEYVSAGINVPGYPRNALGFGRYVAVHPPGRCIPRPAVPLYNERITECQYEPCGQEFAKKAKAQRFCSSKCRDAHNNENPRARESARQRASRTYWLNREVRKYQKRRAA